MKEKTILCSIVIASLVYVGSVTALVYCLVSLISSIEINEVSRKAGRVIGSLQSSFNEGKQLAEDTTSEGSK